MRSDYCPAANHPCMAMCDTPCPRLKVVVDDADRLLSRALSALKYHQQQTRPIHNTTEMIAAIEAHFGKAPPPERTA